MSRYVSRRQDLLAEGVDPADLSVFGAALTQDLSPSKRVTNAAVAVFLLSFGPVNRTLIDDLWPDSPTDLQGTVLAHPTTRTEAAAATTEEDAQAPVPSHSRGITHVDRRCHLPPWSEIGNRIVRCPRSVSPDDD